MKIILGIATGIALVASYSSQGWNYDPPFWAERLGWTLVHSVWQLTIVATFAALLDRILNRQSANARYLTFVGFFCAMIVTVSATFMFVEVRERPSKAKDLFVGKTIVAAPHPTYDVQQSGPRDARPVDSFDVIPNQGAVASAVSIEQSAAATAIAPRSGTNEPASPRLSAIAQLTAIIEPRLAWIVLYWVVGVGLSLSRPLIGFWTQWRLRRSGTSPVPAAVQQMLSDILRQIELRHAVQIAESIYVRGPIVVGYLRPVILLPVNLLKTLTPPQLRAVLAHELAHIRRHDMVVNTLQVLVETVLFYHPAVWWLSRRIREERENCCDDLALRLSCDKATYAQMLLSLEELRQSIPEPALAAAGRTLIARVQRLMPQKNRFEHSTQSWVPGVALFLLLGTVAFFWSSFQATPSVAQQPDSSDRTEPLTGIVLQEDGSPAAGATVNASSMFLPNRISAIADEHGKFRIELPHRRDEHSGSGEFLPYSLAIRWKGFGADIEEALDENGRTVSIEGQPLPLQTIRLKPGCRLSGKLLQKEDDQPIAGAKVFLATGEVLTTNDRGAFEITGVPMQANSLVAAAPGRAREFIAFDATEQPDAELEIRLQRGRLLKGRVHNEQGDPIRNAFVTLHHRGGRYPFNGYDVPCRDDGTFEYELWANETDSRLVVTALGSDPEMLTVTVSSSMDVIERDVTLKKSGTAEIEKQQTAERRTISGVVRDAYGMPIAGATIHNANSCQPSVAASSDGSGRFTITSLVRLESLIALAPGHSPQMLIMDEDSALFELPVGAEAYGVVVDTAGKPIPGVRVITELSVDPPLPTWTTHVDEFRTETNAQGEFRIAHVQPELMTFIFRKEGYSDQRDIKLLTDGSTNTVRLTARGVIRGRVIDSNGRPVRNFQMRTTFPRPRPEESDGRIALSQDGAVHFTRDDGTFVLSGFDANGWLRLVVSSPGVGFATIDSVQTKPLDDPGKPEDFTIQLKPFVPLIVRVEESSSGKSIIGASVRLFDRGVDMKGYGPLNWDGRDSPDAQAVANEMGEVRFVDQDFGSGILAVSAPGFGQRRVPWMPGERTVKVSLDVESRVEGEVLSNGEAFAKGTAELNSEQHQFKIDLAKANGHFLFDRVPEGDYDLWVRVDGQVVMSRHLKIAAGTTQTVALNIPAPKATPDQEAPDSHPAGRKASVRIVDTAGLPVMGAIVKTTYVRGHGRRGGTKQFVISTTHFPQDANLFPQVVTDAEGIATFEFRDDETLARAGYSVQREKMIRETLQQSVLRPQLLIEHPDHPTWESFASVQEPDPIVLADSTQITIRAHRDQDSALADRLYANRRFWNDCRFTQKDGIMTLHNVDLSSEKAPRYLRIVQVPTDGPAWFSDIVDLRFRQGQQLSLDVALHPGVRLEGRLPDSVPRPIKNGRVVASIERGDPWTGWCWMARTEIAADGAFAFESLPRNEHAQLTALCDGWISVCPSVAEVQNYSKEHDFETSDYADRLTRRRGNVIPRLVFLDRPVTRAVIPMARTSVAEVLVVDENNQPIENASVGFSPNQIDFNNGASFLGSGFDQLSLVREQLDPGKPSIEENPWAKWIRDQYFAKTDSRGIASVADIPAGTVGNDTQPVEYLFSVTHDDYIVAKPAVPNREDWADSANIELLAGQKGTVTVTMKRRQAPSARE